MQHCLLMKFASKTDVVKQTTTLRCFSPLSNDMICLQQMHTQGRNSTHFQLFTDQMGTRHNLIVFALPSLLSIQPTDIQYISDVCNHIRASFCHCFFLLEMVNKEIVFKTNRLGFSYHTKYLLHLRHRCPLRN